MERRNAVGQSLLRRVRCTGSNRVVVCCKRLSSSASERSSGVDDEGSQVVHHHKKRTANWKTTSETLGQTAVGGSRFVAIYGGQLLDTPCLGWRYLRPLNKILSPHSHSMHTWTGQFINYNIYVWDVWKCCGWVGAGGGVIILWSWLVRDEQG